MADVLKSNQNISHILIPAIKRWICQQFDRAQGFFSGIVPFHSCINFEVNSFTVLLACAIDLENDLGK